MSRKHRPKDLLVEVSDPHREVRVDHLPQAASYTSRLRRLHVLSHALSASLCSCSRAVCNSRRFVASLESQDAHHIVCGQ